MAFAECSDPECREPSTRRAVILADGLAQSDNFCQAHFELVTSGIDLKKTSLEQYERYCRDRAAEYAVGLGTCYMTGDGVEQNAKQAVAYFEDAARLGSVDAHIRLTQIFQNGVGDIQVDERRALIHYRQSFLASLRPPRNWQQIWLLWWAFVYYAVGTLLVRWSRTAA